MIDLNHDNEDNEELQQQQQQQHQQHQQEEEEQDLSTLTDESMNEMVSRVFQTGEMVELDSFTLENVKQAVKKRIWDKTKFTSMDIIKRTDLYATKGFVNLVLDNMNLTSYNKVMRAKFWNRYGRYVMEVLSTCKCTASDGIKKDVIKGMVLI